ncbi:BtrH N-terminal domain-containing protein [Paenibacillus sp. SC116]|uniref:BtrH N-terminal domain-containing protein n=1 Tax=Paenibacillus sp. SC116 TaxID=2968986 RepID=UPI00215AA347|nr:BtrH N-terminal domain-containing protein [Paenibacillus sp. SC116]MCR8842151.1 BtrH N-terminal domain-containing protein [Paenibacillus sp. SC116]
MEKFYDVKPFNDLFYKNCFFSALFPVIQYFGQPIEYVLAYDRIWYEQNHNDELWPVKLQMESVHSIDRIVNELGLQIDTVFQSENIIADLTEALQQGKLPLLNIDCYALPMRKDLYRQEHWPHVLLICGVDTANQVFYVIEHRERESMTYERRLLSFNDLEQAYAGFVDHFLPSWSGASMYYISETGANHSTISSSAVWVKQLSEDKQMLEGSHLINAAEMVDWLQNICMQEEQLQRHTQELIKGLNETILIKQAEQYRLSKIMPEAQAALERLTAQLEVLQKLRRVIGKYAMTHVYPHKAFTDNSIFTNILYLERECVSLLCLAAEEHGIKENV